MRGHFEQCKMGDPLRRRAHSSLDNVFERTVTFLYAVEISGPQQPKAVLGEFLKIRVQESSIFSRVFLRKFGRRSPIDSKYLAHAQSTCTTE